MKKMVPISKDLHAQIAEVIPTLGMNIQGFVRVAIMEKLEREKESTNHVGKKKNN